MKKSKRLIAFGIVIAQMASYAAITPITSYASTVYAVDDTFESGEMGEWYLRNTVNNPEISIETENGNSFLRLSVTKMNRDTNTNGNDENPCLTRDIAAGISLESGCSVIEAKFRTNSTFFRKYFKINYPKTQGNAGLADNATYYDNGYGDINQNYFTLMHLHQGGSVYAYRRKNTQANTIRNITMPDNSTVTLNQPEFSAMTNYSTDEWYKVKFVINNETDNVSTYLYNEGGELISSYTSGVKDIWYLTDAEEISTLDFFYRATSNNALEASAADTLDIDDVKVYQVTDYARAELVGGAEQAKKTSLEIKFDSDMKADTVTGDNIKLYKGEDMADTTGIYSETEDIYTITPVSPLTTGSYKIVFDTAAIEAEGNDYFDTVAFVTDTIEFEYYQSTPPMAKDATVSGNVIDGETLTLTYTYEQEDGIPAGAPEIQWQYSEDNISWYDIDGATDSEYQITEDTAECFIRAAVIPKTEDGIAGEEAFSNVLMPEKAPAADNVAITGNVYVGQQLTVTYDYSDANGDDRGESIIVWLASDSIDGEYTQIGEGETYQLTESELNKYIKAYVIPVAQNQPYEGEKSYSAAAGPVADAKAATNLLTNGGFEAGDKTNWVEEFKKSGSMEVISDVKYNGVYSLLVKDRIYSTDNWHQKVSLVGGRTYLVDGYARLADNSVVEETIMEGYFGRGKVDRIYRDREKVTVGRAWKRVTLTAAATESSTGEIQIVCWPPDGESGYDYYVDDIYCGELIISDIVFTAPESIGIPTDGEERGTFRVSSIVNQIGTDAGLYNEAVTFELPDSPAGVYIDGNEICVTSEAVSGKITVDAVCTPTYPSAQTEFRKSVEVELLANSSTAPKVSNAVLSGTTEEGNTLTLTYDYYQVEGKNNVSEIKWYAADTFSGSYSEIAGVSGTSHTVDSATAEKYIYAEVLARAEDGKTGNICKSNIAAPKTAPEARGVTITGERFIDSELTGSYTFYDINGDSVGDCTFRWLRSDKENEGFEPIDGATQISYTLTEADVEKYIIFEVTPVADAEPMIGEAGVSAAVKGPSRPVATELEIKKSGNRLIGSYKYTHEAGVAEGNSTYRWLYNGRVISTQTYCDIDSSHNGRITFEVTPIAVKAPFEGAAASVTTAIKTSSSGTGGGGGGGGYYTSAIVAAPITEEQQTAQPENTPAVPTSDIAGHWAENSVRNLVAKGIMNLTEQGSFYPELPVTRADVAVYIAKALGEAPQDYTGNFSDVYADDWFAGYLQTLVNKGIFARDVKFNPYNPITREEMCKLLVVIKENSGEAIAAGDISVFTDSGDVSAWAVEYAAKAYAAGLVAGFDDGSFMPKGYITRAQMAVLIDKLAQ